MNPEQFFQALWEKYIQITPQAEQIQQLFLQYNATIVNDHVAFRTFDHAAVNIESFEPYIRDLGYKFLADYHFPNKHLYAKSYVAKSTGLPKIFLSQLLLAQLSPMAQSIIQNLLVDLDETSVQSISDLNAGQIWKKPTWEQYQQLSQESEYAAWLSVMGLRANHFTISVNHLDHHTSIQAVNQFLQQNQFVLNRSGGEIKGSPEELLEQSSTMADQMDFTFADGETHRINSCYYEFARRYPQSDGKLFQGFVSRSADKIFESTD